MDIVINGVGCALGVVAMAAVIEGYAFVKINALQRLLLCVASLVSLTSRWDLTLIGMAVEIVILAHNYRTARKNSSDVGHDKLLEA